MDEGEGRGDLVLLGLGLENMAKLEGARVGRAGNQPGSSLRRWPVQPVAVVFLALGLAITAGLTTWSRLSYLHSEHRLTSLDLGLAASSITAASANVEDRLGEALKAVEASGRPGLFPDLLRKAVGKSGPFVGVELFKTTPSGLRLLTFVGEPPLGGRTGPATVSAARKATSSRGLAVERMANRSGQRLVYALSSSVGGGQYIGYAEQMLPRSRHVPVRKSSATRDLYYAIYLGRSETSKALLVSDAPSLPLSGTVATTRVPFGSTVLTLAASPITTLGGVFSEDVPWGILVAGVLLSLAGMLLVEWVMRRRLTAESLARENQRLYEAQRGVAETLQRALLPDELPSRDGIVIAARYLPGTVGIEVGGDWYDVVEVDPRQLFFTVGDVAGRGLEAAVLMTALRNAIGAYATDGYEPAEVLEKLGRLVDVGRDGRFATVLCGLLDTVTGDGIVVSAGHLPPVLATAQGCSPLETRQGPPIGMGESYKATLFSLREGDTLVCYTDGLVERRSEPVSEGIGRLCAEVDPQLGPEELLDHLLGRLVPEGQVDDIAILALGRPNAPIANGRPLRAGRAAEREGFEPSDPGKRSTH